MMGFFDSFLHNKANDPQLDPISQKMADQDKRIADMERYMIAKINKIEYRTSLELPTDGGLSQHLTQIEFDMVKMFSTLEARMNIMDRTIADLRSENYSMKKELVEMMNKEVVEIENFLRGVEKREIR